MLRVLEVKRGQEGDDEFVECNNMTLINLVLNILGPTHERDLTTIMLLIQVSTTGLISESNQIVLVTCAEYRCRLYSEMLTY